MKKLTKNMRVLLICAVLFGIMVGLVSQAEPLYKMFCGATGYGGTTQRAAAAVKPTAEEAKKHRLITVYFDGNVDPGLPWSFAPDQSQVTVAPGEVKIIKYHATNRGAKTLVGTAVHNVQPDKAGLYFDKIQCFCFTKQVLKPGETRELPVQFYIDPAIVKDPNEADVKEITLSYTFYLAKDQSKAHVMKQVSTETPAPSNP